MLRRPARAARARPGRARRRTRGPAALLPVAQRGRGPARLLRGPGGRGHRGDTGAAVVADLLHTLHPRETAELLALPGPDRPAALARIWSRKEAYLKGTGTGLGFGVVDPYVGSAMTPARTPGWILSDVPAPAGFTAALAVSTAPDPDPTD